MKKQGICIIAICIFCLIACLPKKYDKAVCTINDSGINVTISAYYGDEEEINEIEMQFIQVFSEKSVEGLNKKDIIKELESIFKQSNNPDIDLDIKYEEKTRSADVMISVPFEKMDENNLIDLNLKEENTALNFINKLTSDGYTCEVKR